jgi:hypothetical protein
LAAIIFLIVLALFIINSFDVPLSAQAKALLTPPPKMGRPQPRQRLSRTRVMLAVALDVVRRRESSRWIQPICSN